MARYKLRRKPNLLNPAKDGLWYAAPAPARRICARDLCTQAARHTTLSAAELLMALELVAEQAATCLRQGDMVELPGLGTLRLEYGSEGVAEPEDFYAALMRRPRVVYRPTRQFTGRVLLGMSYELDGLVDDGISYDTVASWRRAGGAPWRCSTTRRWPCAGAAACCCWRRGGWPGSCAPGRPGSMRCRAPWAASTRGSRSGRTGRAGGSSAPWSRGQN